MDIKEILSDLVSKKVIDSNNQSFQLLQGGTTSHLYLIGQGEHRLVVKLNEPETLKSESYFLSFYKEEKLLPHLHYVDPNYRYIVYSFISGSTNYVKGNKVILLKRLVKGLINNYKTVAQIGDLGLAEEDKVIWVDYLAEAANEANDGLKSVLDEGDFQFVQQLIEGRPSTNSEPFLLHGDCGIHNFIFNEGQLTGVIDPTPTLGEVHYDLIYAFCSTPDDLTKETITAAAKDLKFYKEMTQQQLFRDVLVILYLRIASCIKYHPYDLKDYLKAWSYWKNIIFAVENS